jgi:hypothetical protein
MVAFLMTKLDRPIRLPAQATEIKPPAMPKRGKETHIARAPTFFKLMKAHASAGRPVIPMMIIPAKNPEDKDEKKPSIKYKAFQTRVPTIADIDGWIKKGISLNGIAMLTGKISGIWVLDLDNPEALAWAARTAPDTPIKATTLNGEHWYYRIPDADGYIIGGTNVMNYNPDGVDIRGEGNLIVMPPSVRKFKERIFYQWKDRVFPPSEEDWASLPTWEGPRGMSANYRPSPSDAATEPEDTDGDSVFPEGTRNSTLASRVGGWINKRSRKGTVLSVARKWNRKHCVPPLEDDVLVTTVNSLWGIHYSKHKRGGDGHGTSVDTVFTTPPPEGIEEESEYDEVPEEILKPGGILQMFMDYVEASSVRHIPLFALGAGIIAIGTLMGGKVRTQTGLGTNFYMIGLAPTGEGKNAALDALKALFCASDDSTMAKLLGPTTLASDAALLSSVSKKPVQVMLFDEMGDFMNVVNRRSGSSVSGIPKALKELYTNTHSYSKKSFADTNKDFSIIWHNLSFFGTGIPKTFWESINMRDVGDGFLSRNLILQYQSDEYKEKKYTIDATPKAGLVESMVDLHNIPYLHKVIPETAKVPEAYTVKKTKEAFDLAREIDNRYGKLMREHRDAEDNVAVLYTRFSEYVEKIALVHAISECGAIPETIDLRNVEYANKFMEFVIPRVIIAVKKYIAYNPQDRFRREILSLATRKGHITVRDVYRSIKECDSRQAEDALNILVKQGYLQSGLFKNQIQYRRVK